MSARDVPREAHRRFRADLRTHRERSLQQRAEQLALHEEKKRYIADWVAAHGTAGQQARQAAGVLPMEEAIEAITDQAFAALSDRPLYQRDGVERLQTYLLGFRDHADFVISRDDLLVTSADAKKMGPEQWTAVQEIQRLLPDARVTLRAHKVAWKRDVTMALPPLFAILATQRVGPFTVRREYLAPGA